MVNMFRVLIHPSSGACDFFIELFHGLYCSGTMCVGVTCFSLHPDTTPPQPNHNVTPTHTIPEQYNPWNNSTHNSQAPEDGCINIRNMLSIKQGNKKANDIKLVSLYSTIKLLDYKSILNYKYLVVAITACMIVVITRVKIREVEYRCHKTEIWYAKR